ncbi:Glucosyl-3-phosphoglycerate synthase [uncultured archaeon]|nr:Glucosyl-3-phosphoglycerate synthase [uncultured archaeon]
MDVEKWFEKNRFIATDFSLDELVDIKKKQKKRISCVIPTLNEEVTVGNVIRELRDTLMKKTRLIDEIIVIDSGSRDNTKKVAEEAGALFYYAKDILPGEGYAKGKGENLWKSLFVSAGDIICWVDADIKNINPKFVYGLVGPILKYRNINFSKAFYQRPLDVGGGLKNLEGGRVTELLMRPLYNAYFPQLAGFIQPLSGEYAGTREVLEKVPFFTGYGVEMGLLIDLERSFGLDSMAQVDLETREHRNRPLNDLSKMSFEILQAFSEKSNSLGVFVNLDKINQMYTLIEPKLSGEKIEYALAKKLFLIKHRPPMVTIKEYREKFMGWQEASK